MLKRCEQASCPSDGIRSIFPQMQRSLIGCSVASEFLLYRGDRCMILVNKSSMITFLECATQTFCKVLSQIDCSDVQSMQHTCNKYDTEECLKFSETQGEGRAVCMRACWQ